jgi:hypothetical protein
MVVVRIKQEVKMKKVLLFFSLVSYSIFLQASQAAQEDQEEWDIVEHERPEWESNESPEVKIARINALVMLEREQFKKSNPVFEECVDKSGRATRVFKCKACEKDVGPIFEAQMHKLEPEVAQKHKRWHEKHGLAYSDPNA